MQTRTFSLVQCNLHDLFGDTSILISICNAEIPSREPATLSPYRPGDLRRPKCQTVQRSCAFFHQTHCDTRNGSFNWHTWSISARDAPHTEAIEEEPLD